MNFFGAMQMLSSTARDEWRTRPLAVPWDPNMKWQRETVIQASTFKVPSIFPPLPPADFTRLSAIWELPPEQYIESPSGTFRYLCRRLLAWSRLDVNVGGRRGKVCFDGDVALPALWEKGGEDPWMSLTPNEVWSLRAGTRLARGHTIVAGLGMAHQLMDVLRRPQVRRVTLVERSQELVDWVLPMVRAAAPGLASKLDVVVGDAYQVIPKLTADVCLLDIFEGMGNRREAQRIIDASFSIKRFWTWAL